MQVAIGRGRSPRGSADRNVGATGGTGAPAGRSPRGSADRNSAGVDKLEDQLRSLPARERGSKPGGSLHETDA